MKWIRRALIILLAIPVVVLFLLALFGMRADAGRSRVRIEIDRPPAEVFRHLETPHLLEQWTGLKEVEMLTEGPLRVGSRGRAVAVNRGQRTELETEVTGFEKNESLALALKTTGNPPIGFAQLARYKLDDLDGRTALEVVTDTSYEGLVPRLLEPIITPAVDRELRRELARLKAQVEGEPPEPESPRESEAASPSAEATAAEG